MIRFGRICRICILIVGMSLSTSSAVKAAGFEAYFEYNYGTGLVELTSDLDLMSNSYGFGFALDTNVSRDDLRKICC